MLFKSVRPDAVKLVSHAFVPTVYVFPQVAPKVSQPISVSCGFALNTVMLPAVTYNVLSNAYVGSFGFVEDN